MSDFIRENSSLIMLVFEAIAAITGVLLLKKYKQSVTKYFIYFLVYVVIIVMIGMYPSYFADYDFLINYKTALKGTFFERNFWWFNIFWTIASALFYSFYFIKILKTRMYKKIIKLSTIIFILCSISYIACNWVELFNSDLIFNEIFSSIIILLSVILYFIEMLQSNTVLTFYKSINFYISITVFIWWLVITPLVFYQVYYSTDDLAFVFLRDDIYLIMNIFMYTSFTLALIFCKPENDINFNVKN